MSVGDIVPSTSLQCPWCTIHSHLTPKRIQYASNDCWVIQECDHCSNLLLTIFNQNGSIIHISGGGSFSTLEDQPREVYPYYRPKSDPAIPKEIADDYSEAALCYSAGAYNASVVMCRRAIETAAILKGADPKDRLVDMIKTLQDKGLEQSLIDLSTEIRLLGNTGAHVDKHDLLRNVTKDDCEMVLQFLDAFLGAVYIRPARIAALRKKRGKS